MALAVDAPDGVGVIRIGGDDGFSDSAGLAGARYDAEPGTAYLLRPDGYVAARFRHPTRAALDAALARADRHQLRFSIMALSTSSNFAKPDDAFRAVVEAHRGLSDEQSADLDAALVLILANHIGDLDVLREAIALAQRRMVDASQQAQQQQQQYEFARLNVAKGIELMAKGFASTTDMAEKKITFSEIGTDLYAFTAEGDPNSAVIVGDDGCIVFDAQATPAMANKVIERVRTVTDKPIKYVVLSHYHAVRVLGASAYKAQAVIASQETYRLVEERGQQDWDSEYGRFPRLFQDAAEHSGPDLADADLRRRDVDLSRQTRSAADAARRGAHLRRYRGVGAGCRGDVFRRPDRISFGLLLRRRAFARMAGDAERNSRLQSQGDRAGARRCAQGRRDRRATPSR